MTQPFRSSRRGTAIDRTRPVWFTFDGNKLSAYAGDTLASALLANGVHTVGRSIKYRRPRGIFAAGPEEPNALVTVGTGPERTPNLKATEVAVHDGLTARSQRGWPSVGRDIGAVNGLLSPFLPAGFYYKTFMRPHWLWPRAEQLLRRAAASAEPAAHPDPGRYEKRHIHCDVLVVGAGPAGLAAADAAAASGARVILADRGERAGGSLLDTAGVSIDGIPGPVWAERTAAAIAAGSSSSVLTQTTVFGCYGGGRVGAVQECAGGLVRQRYWHIQAQQIVLATGAIERPLVFPDNDRPGVMLASAVRRYVHRFAVRPGHRAAVITNNDTAYTLAGDLAAVGVEVVGVLDTRPPGSSSLLASADLAGVTTLQVEGRDHVRSVLAVSADDRRELDCDLLCVSGGWTPTVHLLAGTGGDTRYDESWGAFVPEPGPGQRLASAGACNGSDGLEAILDEGLATGRGAAEAAGFEGAPPDPLSVIAGTGYRDMRPGPSALAGRGHAFVDLSTDVDRHDLEVAVLEGYAGPQHVKRYTTMGMGPDQGKTANVIGAQLVAELNGQSPAEVGTTTHRPPYVPVALGALAARESGTRIAPTRRSPMHEWHVAAGAEFMPSGLWTRPRYFSAHGSDAVQAAVVEARNVRTGVGVADVSTLGKIDLRGPGVAELLERVYVNRWKGLPVGKARYGVMLRDDGYVFDDGTTARLGAQHYIMTTTTANAEAVLQHLEFYHQCVWPDLDVTMTSVTDQWAVAALAGPNSRAVLSALFGAHLDVSDDGLPFMGVRPITVGGVPIRVSRISFSGELGYEIAVPADHGLSLWEQLLDTGQPFGIMPYGLEAMDYLRIEKGHLVVGMDIDGRVSPTDLGLGALCRTDGDFIGRRALAMPVFADPDRARLAGFKSVDGNTMITAGAQLVAHPFDGSPQPSLGRITSPAFSPMLDAPIALGLVVGGENRHGQRMHAVSPVTGDAAEVEVVSPHFFDPDGSRLRG